MVSKVESASIYFNLHNLFKNMLLEGTLSLSPPSPGICTPDHEWFDVQTLDCGFNLLGLNGMTQCINKGIRNIIEPHVFLKFTHTVFCFNFLLKGYFTFKKTLGHFMV